MTFRLQVKFLITQDMAYKQKNTYVTRVGLNERRYLVDFDLTLFRNAITSLANCCGLA